MNITKEQFKKLAKKHLIALQGYDVNETIEIFGVGKLYDEIVESGIGSVGGMLLFINALRQTDRYIEMIYMNGACYQFHLLLKTFFPESKPYISKEKDHVITKYAGRNYDITGEVSGNWYTPMTESEIDMASGWSFHRTKVLQIGECPHCEEPIVV